MTDALAVRGERVVALGPQAAALARQADEVVDLAGDALLPAFGDGHAHPLFAGLQALGPPVSSCTSVEAVVAAVAGWVAEHPGDGWVVGGRYDPTLAPGGDFDARWLDAAVPDRPVVLDASDHHTMWVNTEALRRAGIDAGTPDPPVGRVVRRDDGSPLGTLREWDACDLVRAHVPAWTRAQQVGALAAATTTLAAAGVTWVTDAWVELDALPAWLAAAREDRLAARVELAFRLDPARWRAQLPDVRETVAQVRALGHARLSARSVKLFVDGVLEGGTATLLEPYLPLPGAAAGHDPCPHPAPEDHGMPVWRAGELHAAVAAVVEGGLRPHLHAIGDAAVRLGLDALAALDSPRGRLRELRAVLAHCQLVDPADLPRFAELGVVANCEPLWAAWDPVQAELTAPRLGPERTRRQYPLATLVRSGAPVSFGSDWPVTSHVPLEGVQVAVTRVPPGGDGAAWLPHERLTVEEALHAYTVGSAHQAFADDRGVLRPGAVADLVRLSADPVEVAADHPGRLREVEVRATWCAGERTWAAPDA
ncbi:amidohydrolase [Aquipuribacter sp. SD81]|uniref:amidohydrolase n=1 Tax=Aquipuribacter sp. SD81 TaxID=3127703 RepID=UPI003017C67E